MHLCFDTECVYFIDVFSLLYFCKFFSELHPYSIKLVRFCLNIGNKDFYFNLKRLGIVDVNYYRRLVLCLRFCRSM